MSRTQGIILWLVVLLGLPNLALGVQTITLSGFGAIEAENIARAEQTALEDSFRKAITLQALRKVPDSNTYALVQTLPDYMENRGLQDISQYQIATRTRQYDVLRLEVEVKIDDDWLSEWLRARTLTTPRNLRPRILLMISTFGLEADASHEWWSMQGKPAYAPVETTLSRELSAWGENVFMAPPRSRRLRLGSADLMSLAAAAGADFVVTGSVGYTPLMETLYESVAELHLMEVKTGSSVGSWSLSHRGDFSLDVMNTLLAGEVREQIRAHIVHSMMRASPVMMNRELCIDGLQNYVTYQSIINALNATDAVENISIVRIHEHQICHRIRLRGSIEDLMEGLKQEQIAEMDIEITNNGAIIHLISR